LRRFPTPSYNGTMVSKVREPVVAGAFYPGTRAGLLRTMEGLFGGGRPETARSLSRPFGLVVPHAGYMYSGKVAADGYREAARAGTPEEVVILGTNHTGLGYPISIARDGAWRTPLGDAPIAADLADRLVERGFPIAEEAFAREHSIEVQLPFLQYLFGEEIPFVPICVSFPRLNDLVAAGEALGEVVRDDAVLLVASSDFTHYEPDGIARRLDQEAIELILRFDAVGFYRLVLEKRLSICGAGAITLLLAAARELGWGEAQLVSYATSGDITGDRSAVVGYAAIALSGEGS